MTHLIASIITDTSPAAAEQIRRALAEGATMIELRLDIMEGVADADVPALRDIAAAAKVPVLLTLRSTAEGGHWDGSDMDRMSRLIALGGAADYLDIEWASWQRSANLRQKVMLALGRGVEGAPPTDSTRRLILSRHDTSGRPRTMQADLLGMLSEAACDVPKMAWRARTVRDNFEAFDLLRGAPRPMLAICMGEDGLPSRVLAKKFGAFGSFTAVEAGGESAPGQLTIAEMRRRYRWDRIGPATRVCGLIGDPVSHSIGPSVHNAAYESLSVDAIYLPFRVAEGYESFKAFMVEVLARPWLDARGFSITIPHKENALRFARENGATIDDDAVRWGAVNTFVMNADGMLRAANTDGPAVLQCATDLLGGSLAGRRVAVAGAGGMGRTVAAVLHESGADVTVFNRTMDRARTVAEQLKCKWGPWDRLLSESADLFVNCTSIGMGRKNGPHDDTQTTFPIERLSPDVRVLDTVYSADETPIVTAAKRAGCRAMDGRVLFARQASLQLKHWFGASPPEAHLSELVDSALVAPRPDCQLP